MVCNMISMRSSRNVEENARRLAGISDVGRIRDGHIGLGVRLGSEFIVDRELIETMEMLERSRGYVPAQYLDRAV